MIKLNSCCEKYAEQYPDPVERRKFVCDPTLPDPYTRCPHLTGGAVDVRIRGKTNSQMSGYDWNMVAEVMYEAGFVKYKLEDWHFEYGTKRYARARDLGVTELV